MRLTVQKRLAAKVLKCSPKKVWVDPVQTAAAKEAITTTDIKSLVSSGIVKKKTDHAQSRARARKIASQKAKGRQKGQGSRKGTANARDNTKRVWVNKVRLQRKFLQELRAKSLITPQTFRKISSMVTGGYFRSRRHVQLYLNEKNLFAKDTADKN